MRPRFGGVSLVVDASTGWKPVDEKEDDRGAGLVEYALVAVLVAIGSLLAVGYVGDQTGQGFEEAATAISAEDVEEELTPEEKWDKALADYDKAIAEAKATKAAAVADAVRVPVIASGGAGSLDDIIELARVGRAQAAAVASMLHYWVVRNLPIGEEEYDRSINLAHLEQAMAPWAHEIDLLSDQRVDLIGGTPEDFATLIRSESEKWAPVIRKKIEP